MNAVHRIRRQRWQVRAPGPAAAFAVRQALREMQETTLLPALAGAFDAFAGDGRSVHLPRLEIALRVSSVERLAEELPERLGEAVRAVLAQTGAGLTEPPPPHLTPAARLQRYLGSGQLDWFDAERAPAELHALLAGEAARWSADPAAAWPGLLVALPESGPGRAAVFFRLLQLLDSAERAAWADFARGLTMAGGRELADGFALIEALQAGLPPDRGLRLQALGLLLVALSTQGTAGRQQVWSAAAADCLDRLPQALADGQTAQQIMNVFSTGGDLPAETAAAASLPPQLPVDGDLRPGLPLRSAGLVLLHPYLPRLFAALGWVDERHPAGEAFPWASLPSALALLHWLASGSDEPYEYELGAAKLLLGLAPDSPLPVAAGLLGPVERAEGEALLAAVVDHWPAIGRTSADGLRVAFLQRNGLLHAAADGWRLRLQPESFDVLLDRLPWGLSVIRLPWLAHGQTLHVEWSRP